MNTAIYSPNGGNVGIGFAIPSRQIVDVVDSLKTTGTVQRGWLGVQIQDVSDDMAASFSLEDAGGALVADVVDGSPADKAGVMVGDVILKFDGQDVKDARALSRIVAHTEPKDTVPVTVWRNGHDKALQVSMGEAQEETVASASGAPATHGEELGLGLVNLTDEYRAQLGLPEDYSGVVIAQVAPDSDAAEQGLRPGDVIARVDSHPVHSVDEAARSLREAKEHSDHVTLLVRRGDAQQFVSLAFS